jgi:hypothetical protein
MSVPIGTQVITIDRSRCADDPRHTFVQGTMGLRVICDRCRFTDDSVPWYEYQRLGAEHYAVRFDSESLRWVIDLFDGEMKAIER